eukprot:TRINITY_DN9786_c0_g1_i2.p1 TRINITY_DN9786_c0_g1~~TRINITY_DN9786_c0_g1_i2.p1  ORF type:complete len:773 (+),score=119.04 TRINITY_DN9786_c0_g1_i2:17-2335(+)
MTTMFKKLKTLISKSMRTTNQDKENREMHTNTLYKILSKNCLVRFGIGGYHTVIVDHYGNMFSCGKNNFSQLGIPGAGAEARVPERIDFDGKVLMLSCGEFFTVVLDEDKKLYSWGRNRYGQLGIGSNIDQNRPTLIDLDVDVVSFSCGLSHVLLLTAEGEVYCWGRNTFGRLGVPGLEEDCVTSPVKIPFLSGIVSVCCGGFHSIALDKNGRVYVWGKNDYGQTGLGMGEEIITVPTIIPTLENVKTIVSGQNYSMTISHSGEVFVWGRNNYGQLGLGHKTDFSTPVKNDILSNMVIDSLQCGYNHSILNSDGEVYAWGRGDYGRLGLGDTNSCDVPTRIEELSDVVIACGGAFHSLAVNKDGDIFTWGRNSNGQLGLDTNVDCTIAVKIPSVKVELLFDDVSEVMKRLYEQVINADAEETMYYNILEFPLFNDLMHIHRFIIEIRCPILLENRDFFSEIRSTVALGVREYLYTDSLPDVDLDEDFLLSFLKCILELGLSISDRAKRTIHSHVDESEVSLFVALLEEYDQQEETYFLLDIATNNPIPKTLFEKSFISMNYLEDVNSRIVTSDLTLILDNHVIKTHKFILGLHSDYFDMIIRNMIKEGDSYTMNLDSVCNYDAFMVILEYWYTRNITTTPLVAFQVLSSQSFYLFTTDKKQLLDYCIYTVEQFNEDPEIVNYIELLSPNDIYMAMQNIQEYIPESPYYHHMSRKLVIHNEIIENPHITEISTRMSKLENTMLTFTSKMDNIMNRLENLETKVDQLISNNNQQ